MVKDNEAAAASALKRYGFQAADEKPGQQHFNLQGSKFEVEVAPAGFLIAGTAKENRPEVFRVKPTDDITASAELKIFKPETTEKPPEFEILLPNSAQAEEISAENLPNPAVSRIRLHEAMAAALQGSQQITRERERLSQLEQLQANSLNVYITRLESLSAQTRNPELLILASELRRRSTIADLEQILRANLKQRNLDFVAQVAEEHQVDLVSQATLKPRARKEEIQAKTREFGQNLSQITIFDALNAYFDQMAVSNNQSRNPERMKKLVKKAQAELHRSKQNIDQVILSIFLDYYQLLTERQSIGHLSQETMEMAIIAATETQTDLAAVLASQETILPMAMDLIQEHWYTSRPQTQWHPIANKITGSDTQLGLVFSTLKRFGSKSELVDTKWWELVTVSEIKDKQLMANMALYLWQNNQTDRPIFFQLMVKLSQVYPDCQVLREHQASREQVLEILSNRQPQWLVEHLEDLLKLTHKLVCLPSPATDKLNVGFDLEFGEKTKKFKQLPKFPTEDLKQTTTQRLYEVRRRFQNIKFDAAYMSSLTDLSLWLKKVCERLLSVHYHVDKSQQGNKNGISSFELYLVEQKSPMDKSKYSSTFENRGVVIPTYNEFLDPRVMAAELIFFASSGANPRLKWQPIVWQTDKPLSWKEAVWGQMQRTTSSPAALLAGLIALENPDSLNGIVKLKSLLATFSVNALKNLVTYGDKSFNILRVNDPDAKTQKKQAKDFIKLIQKLKPEQALPNKWANYAFFNETPISQEKLLKFIHHRKLDWNPEMISELYQSAEQPEQFFDAIYDLRRNPKIIDEAYDLDVTIYTWLCGDERFVNRLNQRLWEDIQKYGITGIEFSLLIRVKKLSKQLQKFIIDKYQAQDEDTDICRMIILNRTDWPLSFKVGLIRTSTPDELQNIFAKKDMWLKDLSIIIDQWLTRIESTASIDDKTHIILHGLRFLRKIPQNYKLSLKVSQKLSDLCTSMYINPEDSSQIPMVLEYGLTIDTVSRCFYTYENFCKVYLALDKTNDYFLGRFLYQAKTNHLKLPQEFYLQLCSSEILKIQLAGLELLFKRSELPGFKLNNDNLLAREEILSGLILNKNNLLFRKIIEGLNPIAYFKAKNVVIRPTTMLSLAKQIGGENGIELAMKAAGYLAKLNFSESSPPKQSLLHPVDLTSAEVDQLLELLNLKINDVIHFLVLKALKNADLTPEQVEKCLENGQKENKNSSHWLEVLFKYRQSKLTPQQQIKVAKLILSGKTGFEQNDRLLILKSKKTKLVPEAINLLAPLMTGENTQITLSLLEIIRLGPNMIIPPMSEKLANLVLSGEYMINVLLNTLKGKQVIGIKPETLKQIQQSEYLDIRQFAKFFQVKA